MTGIETQTQKLTGAQIFLECLKKVGVDEIFGYPGGVILTIYEALYNCPEIKHYLVRHEQAAIHAAEGYARVTGKAGVALVTSGPGATNAITGIANAYYDGYPLVVFTGQVGSNQIGNDAFQEADIIGITRPCCKHNYLVKDVKDLSRVIKEAFHIATTGKPGPVVVDMPKDILSAQTEFVWPDCVKLPGYNPNYNGHPKQVSKALELLCDAERPVIIAGGGIIASDAMAEVKQLADKLNIPVTNTLMAKGAFPETDERSLGMLGMHGNFWANYAVTNCDVLFAIGTRFNDRITGKLHEFAPNAQIVHIDIDTASISRNIHVDVPIVADALEAVTKMNEYVEHCETKKWRKQIAEWKEEHPLTMKNRVDMGPQDIIEEINRQFDNAIIATDVGQHQMFTTQYIEITKNKQLITSGGLGTMGYGFPAAIGAKLGNPDKDVIAISGDGGMQMNIQEFATAVLEELPLILCVFNNEYLGMVRQWQKLFYGKRYSMTNLKSGALFRRTNGQEMPEYTPDFVKLAESYGAKGIRVMKKEDIAAAFEEAKKNTKTPTLIEFVINPEELVYPMVQPGGTLEDLIMDC